MELYFYLYFRTHSISAKTKFLATLRFYATGTFQTAIADFAGLSQPSVSRIVQQVSEAIASKINDFIYMPRNQDEITRNVAGFYNIACFPNVIGTIDCTHVKIAGQGGEDGEIFRNRKQIFSINVQSIANFDLSFQDIVARWSGSVHDSRIFDHSRVKSRLEQGEFGHKVLLGDGGYKLQTYLMTPLRNAVTPEEKRYNKAQIHVRNTVERKYGVWKRRFPCLALGLRCKLETTLSVIVACAVLHNFCVQRKDLQPEVGDDFLEVVEATMTASNEGSGQITDMTNSSSRRAILKRSSFVNQITEIQR
jgi:nuclease HARBI1